MVRQFLQITLQRSSARSADPQMSHDDNIGDGASRDSATVSNTADGVAWRYI
jgi:hypothetical protein